METVVVIVTVVVLVGWPTVCVARTRRPSLGTSQSFEEQTIEDAKTSYVHGSIDADEFERRVQDALRKQLRHRPGPEQDPLVLALHDEDPDVRWEAVTALRDRHAPELLEQFLALLNDPIAYVRRAAAGALGDLGDPSARGYLVEALDDSDADVRWEAALCLERLGDREALAAVGKCAADPDPGVRALAVRALGRSKVSRRGA